jgi:hypothetical protein
VAVGTQSVRAKHRSACYRHGMPSRTFGSIPPGHGARGPTLRPCVDAARALAEQVRLWALLANITHLCRPAATPLPPRLRARPSTPLRPSASSMTATTTTSITAAALPQWLRREQGGSAQSVDASRENPSTLSHHTRDLGPARPPSWHKSQHQHRCDTSNYGLQAGVCVARRPVWGTG